MSVERTVPEAAGGRIDEGMRLLVIRDRGVERLPIAAGTSLCIGRGSEADLCVDDPKLSRAHCRLVVEGDRVSVTDLGSSNGTRVRGQRIERDVPTVVEPYDLVEVGAVQLLVQSSRALSSPSLPGALAPLSPLAAADGMRRAVVLEDPAMRAMVALLARVAPGVLSVMLLGETGVGKEVFAELVHRLSRRADKAFLRLNCASLSESLLESELFGHEKGAFTGAAGPKLGLLESADGGTVFLDEVGELSPTMQVKLLRVVEERRVTRVGGLRPRDIDVRFVCATHRDLEAAIAAGRFRQDLYFRLNGLALEIPPLRQRGSEVEALARVFLREACERSSIDRPPSLSVEAIEALKAHAWPGNLRELRNVMERAALMAEGVVRPEHLAFVKPRTTISAEVRTVEAEAPTPTAGRLRDELDALERSRIIDALDQCAGNQSRAAKMLGMSRRTLVERLDTYKLPRPRKS